MSTPAQKAAMKPCPVCGLAQQSKNNYCPSCGHSFIESCLAEQPKDNRSLLARIWDAAKRQQPPSASVQPLSGAVAGEWTAMWVADNFGIPLPVAEAIADAHNAAMREQYATVFWENAKLKQQLAEAKADTERLDWLSLDNEAGKTLRTVLPWLDSLREAIDAARNARKQPPSAGECQHQWTYSGTLKSGDNPRIEIEACVRCGVQRKKQPPD